jgi:D-xylose transport system permease protein
MSAPATAPGTAPGAPAVAGPSDGLGAYARRWWTGVKAGEFGSLPIVIGLIIIAIVFQTQNANFLTAGNFVNLIVQAAAITTIAMGIVFVLLLGEIDLSVGYVSGVAGVITALLTLPDGSHQVATIPALAIALGAGLAIGTFHGLIITKVGVPSFIVTLAGLLAWNGVVLLLIGDRGTVIIQNDFFIGFANDFLPETTSWIIVIGAIALYAVSLFYERYARGKNGLDRAPDSLIAIRVAGLAIVAGAFVYVANQDRGVPYVFLMLTGVYILWTYVLNRTKFGRHIYAVGGNVEAARRAGINTDNVKIACFALCSMMAALGGIVLLSRLRSVDTNAGGGSILLYSIAAAVIGGTSLFGGRGSMKAAVLGALVIASIDNGLGLLGLSAGTKFVITGLVLLLAVSVDSVSRRSREAGGLFQGEVAKFVTLSIVTLGLYYAVWLWRTRKRANADLGKSDSPVLLIIPIVGYFFYYRLIKDIDELRERVGLPRVGLRGFLTSLILFWRGPMWFAEYCDTCDYVPEVAPVAEEVKA